MRPRVSLDARPREEHTGTGSGRAGLAKVGRFVRCLCFAAHRPPAISRPVARGPVEHLKQRGGHASRFAFFSLIGEDPGVSKLSQARRARRPLKPVRWDPVGHGDTQGSADRSDVRPKGHEVQLGLVVGSAAVEETDCTPRRLCDEGTGHSQPIDRRLVHVDARTQTSQSQGFWIGS
jgi:hypothetical protein